MAQVKCVFLFQVQVTKDSRSPQHRHACTEIVHTGQSAGRLHDDQRSFDYGPDELLIYQPGSTHAVEMWQAGRHLCVGVSGCGAELLTPGVWPMTEPVRQLLSQLHDASERRAPQWTARLDLLSGLLALELAESQDAHPQEQAKPYASAAREMMDTRFDQIVGMEEVASSLFISPDYLRQLFRHEFGVSPLRYLIRRRIEAACELLRATPLPVREVAARCGFENPYYFARMFKKTVGRTPSAYRLQLRSDRSGLA